MKQGRFSITRRARPGLRGRRQQQGFGGFFILFLIAATATAAALFTFARSDTLPVQRDRATTEAMASVKAALIGYALRRGGPTGTARPGELPCPDRHAPTDADFGVESTPCSSAASRLGRVPWKTLGIPEPRDSAGETLWYAISPEFRNAASNSSDINSDTRGTLTVRGPDGATLTDNAVAVILAPGAPVGQSRGIVGTLACTLVGGINVGTVLPFLCANNYFESITVGGVTTNNASTGGPFIAGAQSKNPPFNDRVAYITTVELIPLVETRVGRELIAALQSYYKTRGFFPWTDNWPYSGGIADTGQSRGRYPSEPNPGFSANVLPQWVAANDWHNFFWYTVSTGYTNGPCKTCSFDPIKKVQTPVTLDGVAVKALIIGPGMPPVPDYLLFQGNHTPRLTSSSRRDNINLYFEDAENRDGANSKLCPDVGEIGDASAPKGNFEGQPSCDVYVTPTSTAVDRDRVYTVP